MALREKNIHEVFIVSLVLKALNAGVQILLSLPLFLTGKTTELLWSVTTHELVEDPHDFVATHIAWIFSHVTAGGQYFAAWYLLSHGLIKLFLVIALIKNKLWAYPVSIFVLGSFILYQTVRFLYTHSIFLVLLTIFDLFVLWLLVHEYRVIRLRPEVQ